MSCFRFIVNTQRQIRARMMDNVNVFSDEKHFEKQGMFPKKKRKSSNMTGFGRFSGVNCCQQTTIKPIKTTDNLFYFYFCL